MLVNLIMRRLDNLIILVISLSILSCKQSNREFILKEHHKNNIKTSAENGTNWALKPPATFTYSNKNFLVTDQNIYFFQLQQKFRYTNPIDSCSNIPIIGLDTIELILISDSNIDSILELEDNFIWQNWISIGLSNDTIKNQQLFKLFDKIETLDNGPSAQLRSLTIEEGKLLNISVDTCFPFFSDLLDINKDGKFELYESLN